MRSLVYLIAVSAKNWVLELRKSPGKLALYLFIIVMLVFTVWVSMRQRQTPQTLVNGFMPLFYLEFIFFAFLMLFIVVTFLKGLSSGDTFFDMNDVNLLFVSPISSKKILIYGLIRMSKLSFLSGFFILFQSTSLGNVFNVGFGGLCLILLLYMMAIILMEIISLLVYSMTNGNERRKLFAKIAAVALFIPAALFFILKYLKLHAFSSALEITLSSPLFCYIPVAGWASSGLFELLSGNIVYGLFYLGLMIACGLLLIIIIMSSSSDYYEDVLCATETAFEKKQAVMDGNINAQNISSRKIKVSSTGIIGYGVKALFGRQFRESLRTNRFIILDTASILKIAAVCIVAFFIQDALSLIMFLQILMWFQVVMIGSGQGLKDLFTHYIYLIPESSFSKIIWSNLLVILKAIVESVIMFGVAGALIGENILIIIAVVITYVLFTLLLIGVNLLFMRWTSANVSAGILIMVYMIAVIIAMVPGLIPALIIGFFVGGLYGSLSGLAIMSCWELLVSLACFALSKSVLDHCDMPTIPLKK